MMRVSQVNNRLIPVTGYVAMVAAIGCAPQVSPTQLQQLERTIEALQGRLARQDERIEAVSHAFVVLENRLASQRQREAEANSVRPALAVVKVAPPAVPPEPEEPPIEIRLHGAHEPPPLTVAPVPPVPPVLTAVASTGGDTLFREALAAYQAGESDDALRRFERFIASHPSHPHVDDAVYWMGECLYEAGDYAGALDRFSRVVNRHPASTKVPDAMLKMGICHQRLGDTRAARRVFEGVIDGFPRSASAELARARLARVGE